MAEKDEEASSSQRSTSTRSSSSWGRGRSSWSSRNLTVATAAVASTFVCIPVGAVFPSIVVGPKMLGIMASMDQKTRCVASFRRRFWLWHVQGWYCCVFSTTRDVFPSFIGRPRCSSSWQAFMKIDRLGYCFSRAKVHLVLPWAPTGGCDNAVNLGFRSCSSSTRSSTFLS